MVGKVLWRAESDQHVMLVDELEFPKVQPIDALAMAMQVQCAIGGYLRVQKGLQLLVESVPAPMLVVPFAQEPGNPEGIVRVQRVADLTVSDEAASVDTKQPDHLVSHREHSESRAAQGNAGVMGKHHIVVSKLDAVGDFARVDVDEEKGNVVDVSESRNHPRVLGRGGGADGRRGTGRCKDQIAVIAGDQAKVAA